MDSWIKLPRDIRKCDWYENPILKSVYLELILIANWKETRWQGIELKVGDAVTGRFALSSRLGLSEQNVRTALKTLEKWGYITRTTTNQYTIVHIKDFNKFQVESANPDELCTKDADHMSWQQQIATNRESPMLSGLEVGF